VREWTGTGRPYVLLHGLFDDSSGWSQFAAAIARPCLAINLPGFGGSDLPVRPRIGAYAEDVVACLEHLDVQDCVLVGHSLGGGVAAGVAEITDRVGSLAVLAPVGFGPIRLAQAFALPVVIDVAMLALPIGLVNPLTVTAAYAAFVSHGHLPSRDLMDRLRRRAFQSAPGMRAAVIAIADAGRAPNGYAHRRLAYDGPAAALWGAKDALVSVEHVAALRACLPQAAVEVWPGMGHHPQTERPRELSEFLATCAERTQNRRVVPFRRAA
jgi:pimeloyl-ACP methyl ester carboxylesterase